jgi:GntR family transcriptional repressor for pyruvate dehydrogenase complex
MHNLVEVLKQRLVTDPTLPAERTLADELGVKRHQLRNALRVLRDGGEIQARKLRDTPAGKSRDLLVRGTNPVEVIELRLALEPSLARLAALRATPLEIARIERAAITPTGADRGTTDLNFHKMIAAASGNALAADVYALIRKVGSDVRLRIGSVTPECPNRIQQRDLEHQAVAAAILRRDPEQAETAMRDHLSRVRSEIMSRMMSN